MTRVLGVVTSLLAAVAVLIALWRYLDVDRLLDGQGPGYGLPHLVVAAAGAGAVTVCAVAALRALRSPGLSRLLLAGPVLLGLLATEAVTGGVEPFAVYDGSYVPLSGAYSSTLTLVMDGEPLTDAFVLLVATTAGVLLARAALRSAPAA